MRIKGQKGHNDATSVLFLSALHRDVVIDQYLDRGTRIKLFRDERIDAICEEETDPYLYYVESGAVEVGFNRGDLGWTVLYVRGTHDIVMGGLEGVTSFGMTRFQFRAVRNTTLIAFTYEETRSLMAESPDFFDDVLYAASMSMAQMGHRIYGIRGQSGTRRILLWLEKLCEANAPDEDGAYRIPCNLTLDEISAVLDIHYATLNKLIKTLKELGIADRTRTHLQIYDRGQIRRLLQEENPLLY